MTWGHGARAPDIGERILGYGYEWLFQGNRSIILPMISSSSRKSLSVMVNPHD